MAIKVNGTTVIDDSRNMSNVGTVTATSFSGSGASLTNIPSTAPGPDFNPTSPTTTYTSSGSWSKPGSIGDNDWVVFYIVGGGGGGLNGNMWGTGGAGGAAAIISALGSQVSSVSFTIGGGGSKGSSSTASNGGTSTINIGGVSYTAGGGLGASNIGGTSNQQAPTAGGVFQLVYNGNPSNTAPLGAEFCNGGYPGGYYVPEQGMAYGAGGGGSAYQASGYAGAVSTYAGNGGTARSAPYNGIAPGGGGAGETTSNAWNGDGAAGSLRIYY